MKCPPSGGVLIPPTLWQQWELPKSVGPLAQLGRTSGTKGQLPYLKLILVLKTDSGKGRRRCIKANKVGKG